MSCGVLHHVQDSRRSEADVVGRTDGNIRTVISGKDKLKKGDYVIAQVGVYIR